MQLKKLSILAISAATVGVPVLNAASADTVKFTQMKYQENNDRMKIDFSVLDFKKDFGTDYTLNMNLSYDSMSGGTPVWDTKSGASASATGKSNDTRCQTNPTLCQDTSSNKELLSDGESSMNNFSYKNAQIDDTRKAVSVSLIKRTPKRDEISTGFAYSKEEDFKSMEASLGYLYNIDALKNNSISTGISFQKNSALHRRDNNQWKDFDMVNFQIGYSKVFTKNFVAQANYFVSKQSGHLSNPYQTIVRYFNISTSAFDPVYNYFIAKEKRPDSKVSNGISLDSAYKAHKNISLHSAYRLYSDDWGITSHTITMNSYIKLLPKLTFIPLIRYYTQTAADFYKAHNSSDNHFSKDSYGSADERLSKYHGTTYSLGFEYEIIKDLKVNIIAATQKQSFGLKMDWASVGVKYAY